MTSIAGQTETAQAEPAGKQPTGTRKPNVGKPGRHVASKKAKSGRKATPVKKAAKGTKKSPGAREISKTATILEMLRKPGGATTKELLKTTGWQPHSVRGFLSGTVRKKLGLNIVSVKGENGERRDGIEEVDRLSDDQRIHSRTP